MATGSRVRKDRHGYEAEDVDHFLKWAENAVREVWPLAKAF